MEKTEEQKKTIRNEWGQFWIWIGALAAGAGLGLIGSGSIDKTASFIATIYTRLFQLLAVPTITLAVINTLAWFGRKKGTGKIFGHTITYTLLTTLMASCLAALLYFTIAPGSLSADVIDKGREAAAESVNGISYRDQVLSIVPDNIVRPFLDSNVLAILLLALALGLGLAYLPENEPKKAVLNLFQGLQDLLFLLIKALVWTLPLGIAAFSAQLAAQISSGGIVASSIGKYVLVILAGNFGQALIILPLFLLARGLNPLRVIAKMYPAVLMALFTKSSAATLPVTIDCAETRLKADSKVARFVLPICTTINMNGCAAFILATSLFVMQNGGFALPLSTVLVWIIISVVAAVGNAGVPMGCFFLTFSLMSGIGAPVAVMGAILPVYTILDMFETAENVWSDSCVCAMTDKDLRKSLEAGLRLRAR